MRGSTSNWWKGGGDGKVHSSVVAPAPHGLSPARSLRAAEQFTRRGTQRTAEEDRPADQRAVPDDGAGDDQRSHADIVENRDAAAKDEEPSPPVRVRVLDGP